MIGLTDVAFLLTIIAAIATFTGAANTGLVSIIAPFRLAAFTLSCVLATWIGRQPRQERRRTRLREGSDLPPHRGPGGLPW